MILGHAGIGFVIKTKTKEIPLLLIILFSLLPEIMIPGVIFSPLFIPMIRDLGFIEYAMRCPTSLPLIALLSGATIGICSLAGKTKWGIVLSICMFVSIVLNFFVEAYWFFPFAHINIGLGIYPWHPVFWIIDIAFSSVCILYYVLWRRRQ